MLERTDQLTSPSKVHPESGTGDCTSMRHCGGSGRSISVATASTRLMVAFDQLQTPVVVVIIEDDEKSTKISALVPTNGGEDLDQVVVGQRMGEGGHCLDEIHPSRPGIGGSGGRDDENDRPRIVRGDLEGTTWKKSNRGLSLSSKL